MGHSFNQALVTLDEKGFPLNWLCVLCKETTDCAEELSDHLLAHTELESVETINLAIHVKFYKEKAWKSAASHIFKYDLKDKLPADISRKETGQSSTQDDSTNQFQSQNILVGHIKIESCDDLTYHSNQNTDDVNNTSEKESLSRLSAPSFSVNNSSYYDDNADFDDDNEAFDGADETIGDPHSLGDDSFLLKMEAGVSNPHFEAQPVLLVKSHVEPQVEDQNEHTETRKARYGRRASPHSKGQQDNVTEPKAKKRKVKPAKRTKDKSENMDKTESTTANDSVTEMQEPKRLPYTGSKFRCQYPRENLYAAVVMVKSGKMSLRQAAKTYSVPKSTIMDRVGGKVAEDAGLGKAPVLPLVVEKNLTKKIKEAVDQGFNFSRNQIIAMTAHLVKSRNLKTPFKNGIPGRDWITSFIRRNSDICVLTEQTIRARRLLGEAVLLKYFSELERLTSEFESVKIWTVGETKSPLLHRQVHKALDGEINPAKTAKTPESVTVICCARSDGGEIPPLFSLKGKNIEASHEYDVLRAPNGAKFSFAQTVLTEDLLGKIWFKEHFVPNCGPERPQVILINSHSAHGTLGLIEAAKEENVILLTFPLSTSKYLCPLSSSLLPNLSTEYNRVCDQFMATDFSSDIESRWPMKWDWPHLFNMAYERTFNKYDIMAAYKKCGISPLNPSVIPRELYCSPADCDNDKTDNCSDTTGDINISSSVPSSSVNLDFV